MKERPILMNREMVQAILAGRKTQTRRPCKAQQMAGFEPWFGCEDGYQFWIAKTCPTELKAKAPDRSDHHWNYVTRCPYGQPGERLWVRETWQLLPGYDPDVMRKHHYEVKDTPHGTVSYAANNIDFENRGWRPSIHMPRWASRLTLEITALRVQRVRDISDGDALAEGMYGNIEDHAAGIYDAVTEYAYEWDNIYATRSLGWVANPWVWAITFQLLGT